MSNSEKGFIPLALALLLVVVLFSTPLLSQIASNAVMSKTYNGQYTASYTVTSANLPVVFESHFVIGKAEPTADLRANLPSLNNCYIPHTLTTLTNHQTRNTKFNIGIAGRALSLNRLRVYLEVPTMVNPPATFEIICRFSSPMTVPLLIQYTDKVQTTSKDVSPIKDASPVSNFLDSMLQYQIASISIKRTLNSVVEVYYTDIHQFTDPDMSGTLRFGLHFSNPGIVILKDQVNIYAISTTKTLTEPINIGSAWDQASQSFVLTSAPPTKDIIGFKVVYPLDLEGGSNVELPGANPFLRICFPDGSPSVWVSCKTMNPTVTTLPEISDAPNNIQLTDVKKNAVNKFIGNHVEYTISLQINNLPLGTAQEVFISPSPLLYDHMAFLSFETDESSDEVELTQDVYSAATYRRLEIKPFTVDTVTLRCTVSFAPTIAFGLPLSPNDYLMFRAFMPTHGGEMIPWQISNPALASSLTLNPVDTVPKPSISLRPQSYSRYLIENSGNKVVWDMAVRFHGSYHSPPVLKIGNSPLSQTSSFVSKFRTASFGIGATPVGPSAQPRGAYSSSGGSTSPTTREILFQTLDTSLRDALQSDLDYHITLEAGITANPTLVPYVYNIFSPVHDNPAATLAQYNLRLGFRSALRDVDISEVTLPPSHLPSVDIAPVNPIISYSTSDSVIRIPMKFTISHIPYGYPVDMKAQPETSLWKLFEDTIIYSQSCWKMGLGFEFITPAVSALFFQAEFENWDLSWDNAQQIASFCYNGRDQVITAPIDFKFELNCQPALIESFNIKMTSVVAELKSQVDATWSATPYPSPSSKIMQMTLAYVFDITKRGTSMISIFNTKNPSPLEIKLLVDNNQQQLAVKQQFFLDPGQVSVEGSYTKPTDVPWGQTQKLELFYRTSPSSPERLINSIPDTTPDTVEVLLSFALTRGYTNAFFRATFDHINPEYRFVLDSVYFDIVPKCYDFDSSLPGNLRNTCPDQGACDLKTNACLAAPVVTEEQPITVTCPHCDSTNTDKCIAASGSTIPSLCKCKTGWNGPTCQQSTQCDQSKSKCNLANGFVELLGTSCTSQCKCYNKWAGLFCQSCTLQCLNSGVNYNDCARCGCTTGFTGAQCQCHGVTGKITINAYNELIQTTGGQFSVSSQIGSFSNAQLQSTFKLPLGSTNDDKLLYVLEAEVHRAFQLPLTTVDDGQFSMSIKPISVPSTTSGGKILESTEFTFVIPFGCTESNPQITTQAQLATIWTDFVETFHQNSAVEKYFTFNSAESEAATPGELTPVDPTVPPEGEQLTNGSSAMGAFISFIVLVMIAL